MRAKKIIGFVWRKWQIKSPPESEGSGGLIIYHAKSSHDFVIIHLNQFSRKVCYSTTADRNFKKFHRKMRVRITWFYIWRLKMTAIKFALQIKREGLLSIILLQCLENSGHISTERNTAFDCVFDGCKICWWKNEMNKNCGIIRGNSDFQGKMDRYGKAGTAWKIEKNIYNQEQICYGIKVIQEKRRIFVVVE